MERDENDTILKVYEPDSDRHSPYGDHYTLTRYQVIGCKLVRFRSHCFEESTFDTPYAKTRKRRVALSGLTLLHP